MTPNGPLVMGFDLLPWDINLATKIASALSKRFYIMIITVTSNLVSNNNLYNLKVVSATFLLVCFLDLNESTCQTRENVFHFTSKALFVLEKIKF